MSHILTIRKTISVGKNIVDFLLSHFSDDLHRFPWVYRGIGLITCSISAFGGEGMSVRDDAIRRAPYIYMYKGEVAGHGSIFPKTVMNCDQFSLMN